MKRTQKDEKLRRIRKRASYEWCFLKAADGDQTRVFGLKCGCPTREIAYGSGIRASYCLFSELYDFLKERPSVADILRKIHDVLDAKWSFGSERNAEFAAKSLELVLRDKGAVAGKNRPGEKHKRVWAMADRMQITHQGCT
jgi:hypothetical protein